MTFLSRNRSDFRLVRLLVTLLFAGLAVLVASADTGYFEHSIFDNSLTRDSYFYSYGHEASPSKLELDHERIPVETQHVYSPPTALRLSWTSMPEGGWTAQIDAVKFRGRRLRFEGLNLYFWCYAPDGLPASALPKLSIVDTEEQFSSQLRLADHSASISAGKWTQIKVPLTAFQNASLFPVNPIQLRSLIFSQGEADEKAHVLIIDDIRIDSEPTAGGPPPVPQNLEAKGFERHIDLSWQAADNAALQYFRIERSLDGGPFEPVGIQISGISRFTDFLGKVGVQAQYRVVAMDRANHVSPPSKPVAASTRSMTDDELLSMLQEACFRYYWDGAHPDSGTALESKPGDDRIVATGATGFGIMALVVGTERGFITREQGLERLQKIVGFLERAPKYHGAWSHFMDGHTAQTLPVFGPYDDGGDLVETAFLVQGLLAARQYFNRSNAAERDLASRITKLWEGVEWDWYRRGSDSDALYWHWSPDWAGQIKHRLTGFNETMIVYILAIASPTHPVPADLYYSGWAGQSQVAIDYRRGWSGITDGDHYANGNTYEGIKLDVGVGSGGPLFFAHYSYL
ncbi:MAG TPA: glucoamylase family protein, partial [Candidatus Acidoferrum sp.]|nr:glucoamylase family protein [Candidatus Acidoferrum sp.]